MKQKYSGTNILSMPRYISYLLIVFLLLLVIYCATRCRPVVAKVPPPMDSSSNGKVSWNILFQPGTSKSKRDSGVETIRTYIDSKYAEFNKAKGTDYKADSFKVYMCPCDTLLYNYDFVALDGAGKSVTTTPPPPPTIQGSHLEPTAWFNPAIRHILTNATISDVEAIPTDVSSKGYQDKQPKVEAITQPGRFRVDTNTRLAIIDSGIDTTLFGANINNLLWADAAPAKTIYNFLPGASTKDQFDDTKNWHGSAVTAIAMKAIQDQVAVYPKLMILKALDSNARGTVFSISCALSYAIQKKASLINLSLGYYGSNDSVLHHYLALTGAGKAPIDVFAAAGNTTDLHIVDSLCNTTDNHNKLSKPPLFYPACFSKELTNITSVTQISQHNSPCFYQNYSNEYVQLGVYNAKYCCAVRVDFPAKAAPHYYEGSSFATAIASGYKISCMLPPAGPGVTGKTWNSLVKISKSLPQLTVGGKYIEYK